jgi:hypothetical protein
VVMGSNPIGSILSCELASSETQLLGV